MFFPFGGDAPPPATLRQSPQPATGPAPDRGAGDLADPVHTPAFLGGKGYHLAVMATLGMPVPPGFTIPTPICLEFQQDRARVMQALEQGIGRQLDWLAALCGHQPLLAVRSGAATSMPGMMDTILNVGLTSTSLPDWIARLGPRAALDSYRRLIQMLGSTAYGVPAARFAAALGDARQEAGVAEDSALTAPALAGLITRYQAIFQDHTGHPFPDSLNEQLMVAIAAIFQSWNNERATTYRTLHRISHSMGTAVTLQAMVFGNLNEESGSGVLFSRDPSTGENILCGEFIPNAQGEDVVAGSRTPLPLAEMMARWPAVGERLVALVDRLERHYRDMQDIEFTVQDGALYILQTRAGKRTPQAAFRIAHDLAQEGRISREEALKLVTPYDYKRMCKATVSALFKTSPQATGLPACSGVATGRAVFTPEEAVAQSKKHPVILVRHETDPNDIAGMAAAAGVLTANGGTTSHAAVVARALDKPCVVGCTDLRLGPDGARLGGQPLLPGAPLTLCGATGRVWQGVDVPVEGGGTNHHVESLKSWAVESTGATLTGTDLDGTTGYVYAAGLAGETALQNFIQAYAENPQPGLYLDLRSPTSLTCTSDACLWDAFADLSSQPAAEAVWLDFLSHFLLNNPSAANSLKGVTLINAPADIVKPLKKMGYRVYDTARTVADILSGSAVVTPEFIKGVIGGEKAWEKLKLLFAENGFQPGVPVAPVHPESIPYVYFGA